MNKLLIISGPTATGKTRLALELAKKFNGELISADSRQIYKGLDILTGKDIPKDAQYVFSSLTTLFKGKLYRHGYYAIEDSKLWMTDEIVSGEEFSVAHYQLFSKTIIEDILTRGKLPIIVGGTGLYINSVIRPFDTVSVPPNTDERKKYSEMSVTQLQDTLHSINAFRLETMNNSDRHNPRRLVRAIEIALWFKKHPESLENFKDIYSPLIIGLTANTDTLKEKICQRIVKRWEGGVVDEVKKYLNSENKSKSRLSLLGLEQVKMYIDGAISQGQAIALWQKEEVAYAKRQTTWYKKQRDIHWFSVDKSTYVTNVFDLVGTWYTNHI